MSKIVLDCQKCGGTLEVTDDMELFKCEYCGMPYLVERSTDGFRIVRLEKRVSAVEAGQSKLRLDVLESDLRRLLAELDAIYALSQSKDKPFDAERTRTSCEEHYRLQCEYLSSGGSDSSLTLDPHPAEVVETLRSHFPEQEVEYHYVERRVSFTQNKRYPSLMIARRAILGAQVFHGFVDFFPEGMRVRYHPRRSAKVIMNDASALLKAAYPSTPLEKKAYVNW